MRRYVIALAVLLAAGCGDSAPKPFDGTVTFRVRGEGSGGSAVTTKPATTFLVVEKPGKTSIVDGWEKDAPKGTQYGRHNFPPGVTAGAIATYYQGLLANAGWRDADVRSESASAALRLSGVTRIEAGADGGEIEVKVERPSAR